MADEALRARRLRGPRRGRRDDHGRARGGARPATASSSSITGISYRGEDGEAVHAPLHERCAGPRHCCRSPTSRSSTGYERITNTPIMTSWGCPFDCTFCSVTAMFGKKYRFRSAESVVAEIKEKKPERIFFYDDNIAANKKRLKRLLQLMIDEGITVPWGAQVRTDVVRDPELLELMRASGCDFVALGLESVNQATLDSFEKSQTVGDIEHAIKVLHDYGIRSHGMFVLGADHDTPDSVRDTVKFAQKNKIDTVMLNILTPLPGTQQFAGAGRRGPHHRARLVVLRRAARRLPPQADDAAATCCRRRSRPTSASTPPGGRSGRSTSGCGQRDAVAQEGVLGPHARVRLALVLLAHVVDGRQEPRPAPPARGAQQAAAAPASAPAAGSGVAAGAGDGAERSRGVGAALERAGCGGAWPGRACGAPGEQSWCTARRRERRAPPRTTGRTHGHRHLRRRLLLGRGAALRRAAGRHQHRGRLHRRHHREPHLRGGLLAQDRPRRGGAPRVRPRRRSATRSSSPPSSACTTRRSGTGRGRTSATSTARPSSSTRRSRRRRRWPPSSSSRRAASSSARS